MVMEAKKVSRCCAATFHTRLVLDKSASSKSRRYYYQAFCNKCRQPTSLIDLFEKRE